MHVILPPPFFSNRKHPRMSLGLRNLDPPGVNFVDTFLLVLLLAESIAAAKMICENPR
jgi:hypothetical protein